MNLCELKHPLREEPGSSQLKRANDVLQAATVPIDGRTWADILDYLYRYSRQINFTDVAQSEESGAFTRSGDWRVFLENSLPFLLARISKLDGEAIDKKYARLQSDFERMPGPDTFSSLLDFCFEELIEPAFNWYETLSREERLQKEAAGTLPEAAISEFRFKRLLANTIGADLKLPLLDFIKIYQKAQRAQAVTQRNFFPFVNQQIWGLKVTDLLKPVDPTSAFDRTESARLLADEVFGKFLNILRQISRSAPDYIAESLKPLQEDFRKRHDPHLALLFTFLELFQYVQGDMNRLSEKHLDFFYRQVLRIQPKPHRPDHAHLVFEVAKHLEQYLLKKDTVFKDGKDNNKADVLFSLDEEIVLDKAAIGSLRTLYLNQVKLPAKPKSATTGNDCVSQEVIALEGVYMAPVANSADGLGQAFPENQIPNWATLGAKESKTLAPGKDKLDHHPNARIGLMLASPVLLLQEGKREINIELKCADTLNLDADTHEDFIKSINRALRKPYYILTESALQQLSSAFSQNALACVKCYLKSDSIKDLKTFCKELGYEYSEKEKLILDCYLADDKIDALKNASEDSPLWIETMRQLQNPLSDEGRTFLQGLLSSKNPYPLGYDLLNCLNVKNEPSCEWLFSCCEIKLLECFLEREERVMCCLTEEQCECLDGKIVSKLKQYYKKVFYRNDLKECLPIFIDTDELATFVGENSELLFSEADLETLKKHLVCNNIFKIALTGEKGWYVPKRIKTKISPLDGLDIKDCEGKTTSKLQNIQFDIKIVLDETEPAIICYDLEKHKEDYQFEKNFPVAKIELNSELKLEVPDDSYNPCDPLDIEEACKKSRTKPLITPGDCCCLERRGESAGKSYDLYQFLRRLQVADAGIDVKVCGIKKNIVIQNDENLLDPNSPFQPFGVRPVVVDAKDIANCNAPLSRALMLSFLNDLDCTSDFDLKINELNANGLPVYPPLEKQCLIDNVKSLFLQWKAEVSGCSDRIFFKDSKYIFCVASILNIPALNPIIFGKLTDFLNALDCTSDFDAILNKTGVSGAPIYSPIERQCLTDNARKAYLQWKAEECLGGTNKSFKESKYYDSVISALELAVKEGRLPNGCPCPPLKPKANLSGPCFYLGSNEIFKKCWKDLCIHLNWKDKPANLPKYYEAYDKELKTEDFEINISVLENGNWQGEIPASMPAAKACCAEDGFNDLKKNPHLKGQNICSSHFNRELFRDRGDGCACKCPKDLPPYPSPFPFEQTIKIESRYFPLNKDIEKDICLPNGPYQADTKDGFMRLCLENRDFFHNQYAITLAKQMMAVSTAVPKALFHLNPDLAALLGLTSESYTFEQILCALRDYIKNTVFPSLVPGLNAILNNYSGNFGNVNLTLSSGLVDDIINAIFGAGHVINVANLTSIYGNLSGEIIGYLNTTINQKIESVINQLKQAFDFADVVIPNEPWTPTIKNICLDYSACAGKDDIDIVHLYPFEGTYKHEDLEANPTLLPVFEDEGTLYIGLSNLRPGSSLNLLFQLAEATADSERDRALVRWYHLANNQWQELRPGFDIISDETKGLTVSGIVKIALPKGITRTGNTVMPPDLFWIKASVSEVDDAEQCEIPGDAFSLQPIQKVKAISEAIAVHTQAARVTFKPESANDLQRLARELPAGSITKMAEPEAGVKKTAQPYASFHGLPPESGNSFYKRVSEHLRHKGRAIAPFDYETLVLEAFPQIFKVKCLNHVFGLSAGDYSRDLDWAPGFVSIAVVPDLTKLKPGQDLEPRAPVSLLEEIKAYLKTKISPFVRLKIMNPRYEKVNLNVRVRLRKGKDKTFYAARLKEDLTNLLAPWYITRDSDKLVFGQAVSESEVIRYIESLDYVDFITCLSLSGDEDAPSLLRAIGPVTARSILTAGEICVVVDEDDCARYSDTQPDCFAEAGNEFPFHQICKTPAPPPEEEYGP